MRFPTSPWTPPHVSNTDLCNIDTYKTTFSIFLCKQEVQKQSFVQSGRGLSPGRWTTRASAGLNLLFCFWIDFQSLVCLFLKTMWLRFCSVSLTGELLAGSKCAGCATARSPLTSFYHGFWSLSDHYIGEMALQVLLPRLPGVGLGRAQGLVQVCHQLVCFLWSAF